MRANQRLVILGFVSASAHKLHAVKCRISDAANEARQSVRAALPRCSIISIDLVFRDDLGGQSRAPVVAHHGDRRMRFLAA